MKKANIDTINYFNALTIDNYGYTHFEKQYFDMGYSCIDNRQLAIVDIVYQYRNYGNFNNCGDDLINLSTIICKSIFRMLCSIKCSWSELLNDAYISICINKPNENAQDAINQCILYIIDTVKKYRSIDKYIYFGGKKIRIMKLIYRYMSQYIRGSKAILANTKTVYIDDIDSNQIVKVNKYIGQLVTNTNTTFNSVKKINTIIADMGLTSKQALILNYRMLGLSVAQIADRMNTTDRNIFKHLKSIQKKADDCSLIVTNEKTVKKALSNNQKKQCIIAIDALTNEIVNVFDSLGVASKILNCDKSAISNCLKGKRETHKGYKFEYDNSDLICSLMRDSIGINHRLKVTKTTTLINNRL
jgi:hypothetical protein